MGLDGQGCATLTNKLERECLNPAESWSLPSSWAARVFLAGLLQQ